MSTPRIACFWCPFFGKQVKNTKKGVQKKNSKKKRHFPLFTPH